MGGLSKCNTAKLGEINAKTVSNKTEILMTEWFP